MVGPPLCHRVADMSMKSHEELLESTVIPMIAECPYEIHLGPG